MFYISEHDNTHNDFTPLRPDHFKNAHPYHYAPFRQSHMPILSSRLADEFGASPSHIKEELDQLSSANLLMSKKKGRQIIFSANTQHPIFQELHSMVTKALGMDQVLESIIKRLGNLQQAFLIDDYAEGKDTGIIDLVLIGDIDKTNLMDLTTKTERYIERKSEHSP